MPTSSGRGFSQIEPPPAPPGRGRVVLPCRRAVLFGGADPPELPAARPPESRMSDIFVSYDDLDRARVRQLVETLEARGLL